MSVVKPIIGAFGLFFYCVIVLLLNLFLIISFAYLAEKNGFFWLFVGTIVNLLIIHLSYDFYSKIVKWTEYSIFAVTFAAVFVILLNLFTIAVSAPVTSSFFSLICFIQIIYVIRACVSTYCYRYRNRKINKTVNVQGIATSGELPEYDKPKSKIKLNDRQKILFCFSITAILILIICSLSLGEAPYGFYTFLRIVTCISLVFFCFEKNPLWLRFIYILFMILYNPVFPIHFSDNHFRNRVDAAIVLWLFFNVLTIILIITGIIILLYRLKREAKNGIEKTR